MAKCKDCLHFEVCYKHIFGVTPKICDDFKDRSRFVELPCNPGTTVYEVSNNTDACLDCRYYGGGFGDSYCEHPEHKTDYPTTQDSPVCEKHFWEVISYANTEQQLFYDREKFGKLIFLTREEAEAELARRTANG